MFCTCDHCKKMFRKGKVLGYRKMSFWLTWRYIGKYEYHTGMVETYVNHPKFMKGRLRKDRKMKNKIYDFGD